MTPTPNTAQEADAIDPLAIKIVNYVLRNYPDRHRATIISEVADMLRAMPASVGARALDALRVLCVAIEAREGAAADDADSEFAFLTAWSNARAIVEAPHSPAAELGTGDVRTWSPKERAAIDAMMKSQDLSEFGLLRQAIRYYQMVLERTKSGEICEWSGDAQRAREFRGDLEQAASALPSMAEGWVCVPREPTQEMLRAAGDEFMSATAAHVSGVTSADTPFLRWYRAMLSAAPKTKEQDHG